MKPMAVKEIRYFEIKNFQLFDIEKFRRYPPYHFFERLFSRFSKVKKKKKFFVHRWEQDACTFVAASIKRTKLISLRRGRPTVAQIKRSSSSDPEPLCKRDRVVRKIRQCRLERREPSKPRVVSRGTQYPGKDVCNLVDLKIIALGRWHCNFSLARNEPTTRVLADRSGKNRN